MRWLILGGIQKANTKPRWILISARLNVIKAQIENHFGQGNLPPDYSALSVIDIGSGGGLISEPLAKLGAQVTGIDASAVSVEVAKRHAQNTGVR